MTTTLLDRVPVDEIGERAREVRFGRTVLTVITAVLFGLGFAVAKAFTVAWLAAAWAGTSVKVGWQQGRGTRGPG